jgi:hypothetical protein
MGTLMLSFSAKLQNSGRFEDCWGSGTANFRCGTAKATCLQSNYRFDVPQLCPFSSVWVDHAVLFFHTEIAVRGNLLVRIVLTYDTLHGNCLYSLIPRLQCNRRASFIFAQLASCANQLHLFILRVFADAKIAVQTRRKLGRLFTDGWAGLLGVPTWPNTTFKASNILSTLPIPSYLLYRIYGTWNYISILLPKRFLRYF